MDKNIIDVDEFLERVQDDKELLLELLDIFKDDYTVKRKTIEEVINAKDFEQLKGIAHSLKGASGNISAKSLRALFIELEEMGKSADVSKATELLTNLDEQYSLFLENVNEIKKQYAV